MANKRQTFQSWAEWGIDRFGAAESVSPQAVTPSSCRLGCALCPSSLGLWICKAGTSKVPSGVLLSGKKCCKGSSYSQPLQGFQLLLERLSAPLCPVQKEKRCQLISDEMGLPARQEDFKMPECALS